MQALYSNFLDAEPAVSTPYYWYFVVVGPWCQRRGGSCRRSRSSSSSSSSSSSRSRSRSRSRSSSSSNSRSSRSSSSSNNRKNGIRNPGPKLDIKLAWYSKLSTPRAASPLLRLNREPETQTPNYTLHFGFWASGLGLKLSGLRLGV